MSTISITRLYNLLSAKVGRETAENLTTFIQEKIKEEVQDKTNNLATKEDIVKGLAATKEDFAKGLAATKEEFAKGLAATKEEFAKGLAATKEDLAKEIAHTNEKIANTKAETIRWMFVFWIGQVLATFGFILLFLKR